MADPIDSEVTTLARRIAESGAGERSSVFRMSWWTDTMLDWAMSKPGFKTELFRFVDVFPALTDNADVLRHVDEYFEGSDVPGVLNVAIGAADKVPGGKAIAASVARRNIMRMAHQFIAGTTPAEAVDGLEALWTSGRAFTCDLLGEKTIIDDEAGRYANRVIDLLTAVADAAPSWPANPTLESDDLGPLPRVNISIKPTALATHYEPLSRELGLAHAKERLRPILRLAKARGAFIHFDMEQYDAKDITLQLYRDLFTEPEFVDVDTGVVIQAYLKDSFQDLADLVAWSSTRAKPITVRLVKGAYWDAESAVARTEGWPIPVFEHKAETDANFERCVRLLHDHHGEVRAAFGSHNLRSLAYAIAYARHVGVPDNGFEIQMIYGMADSMHEAVKRLGLRLRVYVPVGELVPGMAYLVRRLLENTSNESFVRHRFAEGWALDQLLAPPEVDDIPGPTEPPRPPATDPDEPQPYWPEPVTEWRRPARRAAFGAAVEQAVDAFPVKVTALIDGERVTTGTVIESVDPGQYDRVIATSASCTAADADTAIRAAVAVADQWRTTPARDRAAVLFRAAEWMRARRGDLAALEVYEAAKPWDQSDADVCEAIDFCEYYGREMLRLDAGGAVISPPGETNLLRYQGKGVTAVISPWNFPLAIPTGMAAAALVAGNPVILKPAEQTPLVAWKLAEAFLAAGVPKAVFQFLPGLGEDVGARLVDHPDVHAIAFTGSKAVGLHIVEQAAIHRPGQRHVKRVVAEMGGKNALVIDADADPDQAVPAAVYSAFGYAGQKCSAASRLIVCDAIYDSFVERVVGAGREIVVGHPADKATKVGPVIDADAFKRLTAAIERAHLEGRVRLQRDDVPDGGWYVGPTIVDGLDPATAQVARDELFGPVLAVLRARDFDHAIELANDTEYALTAGVFSRSPAHIAKAAAELRAGNVYVNRHITGAVVGRQPFGGYGMSGVGSKAGGPDYLLQFLDPRVVTENTIRQGFVPDL
jgi:RHH-type proline utilization regulon transcriptional repressor/proline dehydrogenase/delta 1-pyrroline-5-carboxylate dehydrogenase